MDLSPYQQPVKPFTRWTADTERAFLLALKATGQVKKAAAAIGRSAAGAYQRRKYSPGFAVAWDEAVAAQQAAWAAAGVTPAQGRAGAAGVLLEAGDAAVDDGALVRWRERRDGWNAVRRRLFLRTLAYTKDVRAACGAAGMSSTSAYRLRGASPAFARAWERALGRVLQSVDEAAYARAVTGWDEPIVQGGKVVGHRRLYSEGLLRDLLKAGQVEKAGAAKAAVVAVEAGRGGAGPSWLGQGLEGEARRRPSAEAEAEIKPLKKYPDPLGSFGNAAERYAWEVARAAGGVFTLKAPPDVTAEAILEKLDMLDRALAREAAEQEAADWAEWQAMWGSGWPGPRDGAPRDAGAEDGDEPEPAP